MAQQIIIWEAMPYVVRDAGLENPMDWDVFISHASEDKATVARPLAELLRKAGLKVWLDENELTLGDSLSRKIDEGLPGQAHPVPSIDTNVNPEGAVSVTFTIPLVGTEPTGLDTTAV